ncbi:hypothetical protein F0H41_19010 [Vibrio cholerae]|uniref:hypothetical protein n=1 Tax=Vibrio cholerae TaxID=666 RepID=UPI0011F33F1E|nr:hypothetical protein [Vibrio cholerae]KAA0998312.1 hypothetical protein F0H41_19010 [Vibrio cholerae]KAA1004415.1 hypothetical protein F0H40_19260 [Vibrio cholerae]KAA1012278.1 hypothetical protein F0H43_19065 [Vibrio cholerae]KAA1019069.1 hypothetical protein F0H42_19205 [Vibrio cholerae]KAA1022381.1 hypothetical protein F0H44_18645 [Vibrio cholerae]
MVEMGFWGMFGVLGSFASILSLVISNSSKWSKILHALYSLFIVALVLSFTSYQDSVQNQLSELNEIKRIERQAESLSNPRDLTTHGNMVGYSLSVLAFLEKHQDKYPETYARAKEVCANSDCTGSYQGRNHFTSMQNVSSSMRELIRGISTLDGK